MIFLSFIFIIFQYRQISMERPLMIFIVGTTAVGKTKLSIQLCKAIGGEVINCDSKQLYKHANIMTAKADLQQRQGVPHHMLDVLELNENCYNRNKYFIEAMKSIKDIKSRGKVPIIVGGTNYYLQTLLYDIKMEENEQSLEKKEELIEKQPQIQKKQEQQQKVQHKVKQTNQNQPQITVEQISQMNRQEKYVYLKKIDPVMAQKLHQNDDARITSFLTRYVETGVPPSLNYKPQIHKLRYPQSILFWIRNQNKKQLHQLMQNRIDKMVDAGGLVEILSVFKYADIHGLLEGLKMGALQSIGYKEFKQAYEEIRDLLKDQQFDNELRSYTEIEKLVIVKINEIRERLVEKKTKSIRFPNKNITLLEKCKQILTKNTIDYSKRQITWIRNRLFGSQENHSNFFVLELGKQSEANKDLMNRFELNVKHRALEILHLIQTHGIGYVQQNGKQFNKNKYESINEWKKYYCEECRIEANGSHEWREHLFSRKHRESKSKKQRIEKIRQQKEKYMNRKLRAEQKLKQQKEDSDKQCQNSQEMQKGQKEEQPQKLEREISRKKEG